MSDFLKHAGAHLAHEAMKSGGCMVTFIAMLTGWGALCTLLVFLLA